MKQIMLVWQGEHLNTCGHVAETKDAVTVYIEDAPFKDEIKRLQEQVNDMYFVIQSLAKDDDWQVYDLVDPDFKNLRDIAKLVYKGLNIPKNDISIDNTGFPKYAIGRDGQGNIVYAPFESLFTDKEESE